MFMDRKRRGQYVGARIWTLTAGTKTRKIESISCHDAKESGNPVCSGGEVAKAYRLKFKLFYPGVGGKREIECDPAEGVCFEGSGAKKNGR